MCVVCTENPSYVYRVYSEIFIHTLYKSAKCTFGEMNPQSFLSATVSLLTTKISIYLLTLFVFAYYLSCCSFPSLQSISTLSAFAALAPAKFPGIAKDIIPRKTAGGFELHNWASWGLVHSADVWWQLTHSFSCGRTPSVH